MIFDTANNLCSDCYTDWDKFLDRIKNAKNSVIVIDDATFLIASKKLDSRLVEVLTQVRHRNNIVYIVMHSLASVNNTLLAYCDKLVLFKTNDRILRQEFRGWLDDVFMRVNSHSDDHYYEEVLLK